MKLYVLRCLVIIAKYVGLALTACCGLHLDLSETSDLTVLLSPNLHMVSELTGKPHKKSPSLFTTNHHINHQYQMINPIIDC